MNDGKIYIVVPKGVQVIMPFDGQRSENIMMKFSKIMMLAGSIREGDYVETDDGHVGYIESICRCERCHERGFFEPIVQFTDGSEDSITVYEAENDFKGYKRIGRWEIPNAASAPMGQGGIERLDEMKEGNVWNDRSGGWLYAQQKKINELVDAVNELKEGKQK